jgi:hypothetical protein
MVDIIMKSPKDRAKGSLQLLLFVLWLLVVPNIPIQCLGMTDDGQERTCTVTTQRSGGIDLALMGLSTIPDKPTENGDLTILLSVQNKGPTDATNVTIIVSIDGANRTISLIKTASPVVSANGSASLVEVPWSDHPLVAGLYVVMVTLQNSSQQVELVPSDNIAYQALEIGQLEPKVMIKEVLPDLPQTHFLGEIVNITAGLTNIGDGFSPGVNVFFLLDGELTFSTLSPPIPSISVQVNVTYSWNTSGARTGVHVYTIGIEGSDEFSKSANITLKSLSSKVSIVDISFSPKNIVVGNIVNISLSVMNSDPTYAISVAIFFDLDLGSRTLSNITRIVPPENIKFIVNFLWDTKGTSKGDHIFTASTDGGQTYSSLIELMEPKTKIEIINVHHDSTIDEGNYMSITVVLRNSGTVTGKDIQVMVYQDNVFTNSTALTIAPGEEKTVVITILILYVVGDRLINIGVIVGTARDESVVLVKNLPTPIPNIEIVSFGILPSTATRGQQVRISLLFKNSGSSVAYGYFLEILYDSDSIYQDIRDIPLTTVDRVNIKWQVPPTTTYGHHALSVNIWKKIKVELDAHSEVSIDIPEPIEPMLEISLINMSKIPPNSPVTYTITEGFFEGETIYLSVTITNSGKLNATSVQILIKENDKVLDQKTIKKIPYGGSQVVVFEWTPRAGRHVLTFELEGYVTKRVQTIDIIELLDPLTLDIIGASLFFIALLMMVVAVRLDLWSREDPLWRAKELKKIITQAKKRGYDVGNSEALLKEAMCKIKESGGMGND